MRSDDYTRPAAVSWGPGRDDVFVRGVNSDLQHAYFANGSWSGWESLGGYITSDPTAASRQANIVDVFARGTDAALWSRAYVNGWYNWYSLGGILWMACKAAGAAHRPRSPAPLTSTRPVR
jgi:hypothetical protein